MKILLTNDDGIGGEGLRILTAWAKQFGDLLVVAPKVEQSAMGQSIILRHPFEVQKSNRFADLGVEAYEVDSTPADCVRFAVDRLGSFDFVFSGINRGVNLGFDISYSGTCAAVFEASFAKIPAVAFSTSPDGMQTVAEHLNPVWEFVKSRHVPAPGEILNINIPSEPHGIRFARQGGISYRDHFVPKESNLFKATTYVAYKKGSLGPDATDLDVFYNGFVSVTPLQPDRTDYRLLKQYESL